MLIVCIDYHLLVAYKLQNENANLHIHEIYAVGMIEVIFQGHL